MELGLVIASLVVASLALLLAVVAIIMIVAREKATHTVQMVPVDEEIERANEEFLKQWATSDEVISKQNKMHREEVEEQMPEFALDDEDKEIFSI